MVTPSPLELDLDKLVHPLRAGLYCPEEAAIAAHKLTAALEHDPDLHQQLPADLKGLLESHLLTEDDEDIVFSLRCLDRKLQQAPKKQAPMKHMIDARVLDGRAECAHWRSHTQTSNDDLGA